jgi:hypothetical protein
MFLLLIMIKNYLGGEDRNNAQMKGAQIHKMKGKTVNKHLIKRKCLRTGGNTYKIPVSRLFATSLKTHMGVC